MTATPKAENVLEPPREAQVEFETSPEKYRHWKLGFDGPVALLTLGVQETGGLRPGYALKLNSYDLGVDIELADALNRIRFEHPEVRSVVLTSASPRIFSAGANIYMLAQSSHPFKVNFCKFTNETRLGMEDTSAHGGPKFIAALNGTASGGGYELALACDEILLIDDASSAVSLPEVALLAVLPGTGGLTRVTDKRKVRRDLADVFCALPEGVKGKRAVEWRLVDEAIPRSQFDERVKQRAEALAAASPGAGGTPLLLAPLAPEVSAAGRRYRFVTLEVDADNRRLATLTVRGPKDAPQEGSGLEPGPNSWHLRAFRELDDALLHLRFNWPEVAVVRLVARGDAQAVLRADKKLLGAAATFPGREILGLVRRTLKHLDVTSKTFYAVVDKESAFAGSLLELALAADRTYMLDHEGVQLTLGPAQFGPFPTGSGLTRLGTRLFAEPEKVDQLKSVAACDAARALEVGLATFTPDSIDFEEELRLAFEERAALSPDALTGMEQNLRVVGPETMETKIFGRLSAWQNWIFTRPNATGEKGALPLYGRAGLRPEFDLRRT